MSTSKIIESIKTNPSAWSNIGQSFIGIIFAYNLVTKWKFVKASSDFGGGYLLKNDAEQVKMVWREDDAEANQLFNYFLNYHLSFTIATEAEVAPSESNLKESVKPNSIIMEPLGFSILSESSLNKDGCLVVEFGEESADKYRNIATDFQLQKFITLSTGEVVKLSLIIKFGRLSVMVNDSYQQENNAMYSLRDRIRIFKSLQSLFIKFISLLPANIELLAFAFDNNEKAANKKEELYNQMGFVPVRGCQGLIQYITK